MTELDNKFRLNEARRNSAKKGMQRADGFANKKKLYGKKEEFGVRKKRADKFKGLKQPMAVAKKAKNIATAPTKIQPSDIPIYGTAFMLAGLKDLLDLSFIGSLPAIGTAITFCISIAIGFVLLFDGVSGFQRKVARRMTRRFLVLIAGTMVEGFLFGLNFLPFEMITVGIIYWMSLSDRKK